MNSQKIFVNNIVRTFLKCSEKYITPQHYHEYLSKSRLISRTSKQMNHHISMVAPVPTRIPNVLSNAVNSVKSQTLPPILHQLRRHHSTKCNRSYSLPAHCIRSGHNNKNNFGTSICLYSKFTAALEPPNVLGSQPLCEERADDLISNLKDSERAAIKSALDKYEAIKLKKGFEGKLAATQWRTRFGRLSKVPALGDVDPTGSFCAFPDDWLKKKAAEKAKEPTNTDLWKIFFVNAVPFVAFGFLDNFVMIVAGDYIEYVFGTFMCISTMAAAGLGNTVSDILGIGSAYYVERSCEVVGLKPPDLTPIQMEMKSSRRSANLGRMIGITVGCVLGMSPLLLMDKKSNTSENEDEETKNTSATTV